MFQLFVMFSSCCHVCPQIKLSPQDQRVAREMRDNGVAAVEVEAMYPEDYPASPFFLRCATWRRLATTFVVITLCVCVCVCVWGAGERDRERGRERERERERARYRERKREAAFDSIEHNFRRAWKYIT
jgi:hypothetical protein